MSLTELYFTDSAGGTDYNGASGIEIVTIGDRTFVYAAATFADAIIISELRADGTLTEIGTVPQTSGAGLNGVSGFASTEVNGTTYLYAAGEVSDAITVYQVGADGMLTSVQTVFDSDDTDLQLDGSLGELTIATSGGNQFLITQGYYDDGLSVFQIGANGQLTNTDNIDDADSPALVLNGPADTAFIEYMGTSFVFATGHDESGVGIFSLSASGQLTLLNSLTDTGTLELSRAHGVEAAIIGGTLFMYVAGNSDDGISVFSISAGGAAVNVFNYSDSTTLSLNGIQDLDIFEFGGTTYLAATLEIDDGITLFSIEGDGSLMQVDSVFDSEDAALELDGAAYLEFVEVDGQGLLVVGGFNDDGISVFSMDMGAVTIEGTAAADLLVGTDRGEEIDGLQGDDAIVAGGGDDSVNAGEGNDLVSGGDGDDRIEGDGDLTQTASDVVTVAETGQDLALSVTIPDSSDGTSIEISGIVNRIPNQGSDYNIVYVIDTSSSMSGSFSGTETVGDLNNDGQANTLLDGTVAAFQSLNDSLVAAGFSGSDVAVVEFASSAVTTYSGSALGGVNAVLEDMRASGNTDFEDALQQAILALQGMGSGQNVVYFISDGAHNGGAYADEVATLIDSNGLNATINAFGLGSSANLNQLDLVDDGTSNGSAIRVLEPSTLTGGLTGSPVDTSEVDRLEIYVNGVLVRTVDGVEFSSTPLGLQYNATIDGLSTTAGDTIEVILVASDSSETEVSVSLTVPNETLIVGDDTLVGGAGDDSLDGDGGNDTLMGESGDDLLVGGTGHDLLDGGSDDDRLFGDGGNDTLIGGSGADTLTGGIGDDVYYVDGSDLVDESTGGSGDTDTIVSRTTIDLSNLGSNFLGDFEAVQLIGTIDATARGDDGANSLVGNEGDNLLVGRDGADTLSGGDGDDTLNGGADEDLFIYSGGADVIEDFSNDLIEIDPAFWSGNLASVLSAAVVQAGNLVLDFGGGNTLTLNGVTSTATLAGRITGGTQSVASDLNGDMTSDILWHNGTTGQFGMFEMQNGTASWQVLGSESTAWQIAGLGDFDGDGTDDILWRNDSSGGIGFSTISSGIPVWNALGQASSAWGIVGVGDFNGDGTDDILWQNSSNGGVGMFAMSGGTATWQTIGGSSAPWEIVATGDITGDGIDDIIWRNSTTGQVGQFEMSDSGTASWSVVANVSNDWRLVGTGDLDGDGTDDLLWRHESSGAVGYYAMGSGTPVWQGLGQASFDWDIVGTGDYNGDGTDDILWRNVNTGTVGMYDMDGGPNWQTIGQAGLEWDVEGQFVDEFVF
ncbi:beta strand repeat-containing protein [Nioella sediminis]|uniref:beta strand repeat-containing protein n=1 Tax=Nioella sediminis TaxID=1912092 RepID=UPI0008FD2E80|nr:FG-GAP-like repeat-containing protein [Nioella sediminis]TBX24712.1 hypothetical protein TK43_10980 [Roseovarius sp. JS7-11]